MWKKASDQAYSAQNVPSIVLLVALGVLLYFSEDVPWVHVYQIPMILVALVIVVAVHWGAAKFRLGQVWRCPHCHEALPIHKGVDKGDTKWMPDESVSVCPHCQKNL